MQPIRRSLGIFAAAVAALALAATGVAAASSGHHLATTPRPPHHQPQPPHPRRTTRRPRPTSRRRAARKAPSSSRPTTRPATPSSPTTATPTARSPRPGVYPTGGLGGVLDRLGRRPPRLAGLARPTTPQNHLLYAVNAGSNTDHRLRGRRRPAAARSRCSPSGGELPGQRHRPRQPRLRAQRARRRLDPGLRADRRRSWSTVARLAPDLGLDPTATPEFTHTPGQVAFTPDGSKLVVTTKGERPARSTSSRVDRVRRPSARPVVTSPPDAVPFASTFDRAGRLLVTEAGPNAVATFTDPPRRHR